MKKFIALLLALACVFALASCSNTPGEPVTLSIIGEHEFFEISNGSIVLSDTEEVFDGGDLQITQSGVFEAIASYSTTFYTLTDGEQRIILSNSVIDQTGGTVNGDLGKASGKGIIIGDKVKSIEELKENLWFELITTDLGGTETVYQIQLTLTDQIQNFVIGVCLYA